MVIVAVCVDVILIAKETTKKVTDIKAVLSSIVGLM